MNKIVDISPEQSALSFTPHPGHYDANTKGRFRDILVCRWRTLIRETILTRLRCTSGTALRVMPFNRNFYLLKSPKIFDEKNVSSADKCCGVVFGCSQFFTAGGMNCLTWSFRVFCCCLFLGGDRSYR